MIKVGFCVSYDWEFLKHSIPRVYQEADIICLALDKDRHSWKCNPYQFDDDAFYAFVKSIDTQNKIDIYEDDFSLSELNSRENCNRHRMMIAERMGKGGWHIQVDSDEYFLDFSAFVKDLKKIHTNPTGDEFPINVCVNWTPIIKKVNNGFLFVDFQQSFPESFPAATTTPNYERARHNGFFNIYTKHYAIHQTQARNKEDLTFKINNWGHSAEELKDINYRNSLLKLWDVLDEYNYTRVKNFNFTVPEVWPSLNYCKAENIEELISKIKIAPFPLNNFQLRLKNSLAYSRLKKLLTLINIKL